MDVFVGEYVCGGGFVGQSLQDIPESLRCEGLAMLRALVEDFAEVADKVHVAIDPRFELPELANVQLFPIVDSAPLWPQWIKAARGCDQSLIVAPETDGVLAQSVAMLQATGIGILNGFGDFLRCASNKYETARIFAVAGVAHPPTWTFESIPLDQLPAAKRWVVKPRDGCGTEDVVVYPSAEQALAAADKRSHLIQPWIEGRAVSIAVIVNNNDITVLPAVSQNITAEDIAYKGGCGPLGEDDQRRAASLARSAIQALPRTIRGFVGLDLLLGHDPSDDCVIEVNPRVTTSYVGLRKIVEGNLAARILGIDRSPVRCQVDPMQVHWRPNGETWISNSP